MPFSARRRLRNLISQSRDYRQQLVMLANLLITRRVYSKALKKVSNLVRSGRLIFS